MKKIKKILLAFAPLGAIAIATPIVLTACSTTTGTTTQEFAPFAKDDTNSATFELAANSEAQAIITKYKASADKTTGETLLGTELASFPKTKAIAEDVLKMWSNNNWFTINKTATDTKVRETFISSLTIKEGTTIADGKATFDVEYKNAFVDKNGRTFEATQELKSTAEITVDTSTSITIPKSVVNNSYKLNGEDQTLSTPDTNLLDETTPTVDDTAKTNFETFLKKGEVALDAKAIFIKYIENHGITTQGTPTTPETNTKGLWVDNIQKPNGVTVNTEKTEVTVDLTNIEAANKWYDLDKTTTKANLIAAVVKDNKLTDKFKDLITNKETFSDFAVAQEETTTPTKAITFTITLTKKATKATEDQPKLKLIVKNFV